MGEAGDFQQRQALAVVDHWEDQAVFYCYGYAYVDIRMDYDSFVDVACVDARVAAEGWGAGFYGDVVVGDGFFGNLGCFERGFEADDVFHVDVDGHVEVRNLAL